MEIKCKVNITLPEALIEALGINNDTSVFAYLEGNKVTLEFEEEDDFDEEDYTEDDLADDDDCGCEDGCDNCEYLCPHCNRCTLD